MKPREMSEERRMKGKLPASFESYLGAAAFACGVTWFWDYFASFYFPGQMALNLTFLSALVYLEAAFLSAFGLTRRMQAKQIPVGIRVGLGTWMTNMVFRLIIFELDEALWGVAVYFVSFMIGGFLGGLFAKTLHKADASGGEKAQTSPRKV